MNKKIKVAILGGGINSAVGPAHINALKMTNLFDFHTACFSTNADINRQSFLAYNIKDSKLSNSLDEIILQKDDFDVAIILTPTNIHFPQIIKLLENDIDVISEKSITSNLIEAEKIKSKLGGNFLRVIYNYLGYPLLKLLKENIENDMFGFIHQINLFMPQESFIKFKNGSPLKSQEWRRLDGEIPTVSLDLAVHLHSILKYLIKSNPKRVVSISKSFGNFDVIDNVNSIIELENGSICNFNFNKTSLGQRNGLGVEIFGKNCSMKWTQINPEEVEFVNQEGERKIIDRGSPNTEIINDYKISRFKAGHPGGYTEALANYYLDIYSDYLLDTNLSYGINESISGLKLLNALKISSKKEKWINI